MRESERRHQQQLDETKREMGEAKRRMDEMVAFLQKNVISSLSGYSGNTNFAFNGHKTCVFIAILCATNIAYIIFSGNSATS